MAFEIANISNSFTSRIKAMVKLSSDQKAELNDILSAKVDSTKHEFVAVNWLTNGIKLRFNQQPYFCSHYWCLTQCEDGTYDFVISNGDKGVSKNFDLLYEFMGYFIEELEEIYNDLSNNQWVRA